jgi:small subunit ribosomal protein S16
LLVIRLARAGRTKYPTYRIVAAESARAATGRFVEVLGHYNPHTKELVIKRERIAERLQQGAQPSNSMIKLLTREKLELPAWAKLKTKAPKAKEETAQAPAAEAAEAKAEETADAEAAPEAEEEVRVAQTAEEQVEAADAKAPDADTTETAN